MKKTLSETVIFSRDIKLPLGHPEKVSDNSCNALSRFPYQKYMKYSFGLSDAVSNLGEKSKSLETKFGRNYKAEV